MFLRKYPHRFAVVSIFLFLGFAYSIGFLIFIQIFRSEYLSNLAQRQHEHSMVLEPRRGTIYDRNMRALAINLPVYSVYANARAMRQQQGEQRKQTAAGIESPGEQQAGGEYGDVIKGERRRYLREQGTVHERDPDSEHRAARHQPRFPGLVIHVFP